MILICLKCQKEYEQKPCLKNKSKFCCRKCKVDYSKGKHLSPTSEFKKGVIPWNKGRTNVYSPQMIDRLRTSMLGKKRGKYSLQASISHSLTVKRGELSHFWKGGVTSFHEGIRKTLRYKLWRRSVFERDNYTCVWCKQRGGRLQADHIKYFSIYPELRFEVSNGQTLCVNCHLIKTKSDMVTITKEVYKRATT